MSKLKPKNVTGKNVFVKPYKQEQKTDTGIITPDSVDGFQKWWEITRVGKEVENYEVGQVVLVAPSIIKRQIASGDLQFIFEKDEDGERIEETMIQESNILAEADFQSNLEL